MKRFISLAVLILIAATAAFAQANSKNDVALKALIKQMTDAQIAFDAGALDKLLTADYIEISPLGEFDPRDKVLGFYKPELKPRAIPTLELGDYSIRDYEKFAIVIVKLSYIIPVIRQPAASMRATFVCRAEKGGWKIASSQYTGIRPPQPSK